MKRIIVAIIAICVVQDAWAQVKKIKIKDVKRVETILASDDMQGRRTFTPGIEKASAFIEEAFKKAGLQTFNGAADYKQQL